MSAISKVINITLRIFSENTYINTSPYKRHFKNKEGDWGNVRA